MSGMGSSSDRSWQREATCLVGEWVCQAGLRVRLGDTTPLGGLPSFPCHFLLGQVNRSLVARWNTQLGGALAEAGDARSV